MNISFGRVTIRVGRDPSRSGEPISISVWRCAWPPVSGRFQPVWAGTGGWDLFVGLQSVQFFDGGKYVAEAKADSEKWAARWERDRAAMQKHLDANDEAYKRAAEFLGQ